MAFYKFAGTGSALQLTAWGNTVEIEKGPFLVRFSPDRKFAICNALAVPNSNRGAVNSIQIAATTLPDGTPVHKLISHAETGFGPEGLAVSPDGRWVVTTNFEQTWRALGNPKRTLFASLTLLRLDTAGHLERVQDFAFSGMLPETAIFDNSSKYIAIADFNHNPDLKPGGSVDFWHLQLDKTIPDRVELIKTGYSIPVRRGVHSMVLIR